MTHPTESSLLASPEYRDEEIRRQPVAKFQSGETDIPKDFCNNLSQNFPEDKTS
jgi:hypothetical protein